MVSLPEPCEVSKLQLIIRSAGCVAVLVEEGGLVVAGVYANVTKVLSTQRGGQRPYWIPQRIVFIANNRRRR